MTKKIPSKVRPALIDGKHPLLAHMQGWEIPALAKATGYPVNTLYMYRLRARRNKKLLFAAEFVVALCKATGTRMSDLRPDLWKPEWDFGGRYE